MTRPPILLKLGLTLVRSRQFPYLLAMLLLLGGLIAAAAWVTVQTARYGGRVIDALTTMDAAAFAGSLKLLGLFLLLGLLAACLSSYLQKWLMMEARTALTYPWLRHWLDDEALYRIEREQRIDNPDQRIASDLNQFLNSSIDLGVGAYSAIVGIATFATVLWREGGSFAFNLAGREWVIHGYMVWVALLYAVLNTWLNQWVARPLTPLRSRQLQVEADFRFGMMQVRENAEQVALYRGADTEFLRLTGAFEHIRQNWKTLCFYQLRWMWFNMSGLQLGSYLPYALLAPKVLSGAMTIGTMTALRGMFTKLMNDLNWLASVWGEKIVLWLAVVRRLRDLDAAIDARPARDILLSAGDGQTVSTSQLSLSLPDGSPLAMIGDVRFGPGERWLVRGPSGAGKSTMLRAVAGLWPFGGGKIAAPRHGMLFVPQKGYLPHGTLKAALTYPRSEEVFDDEACRQALFDCRLPKLADRLHEIDRWAQRLSPGEQQRLAFARALLIAPEILFLDEATSALDIDTEQHLYALLLARLPRTALVSVAHRTTVDIFHTHCLLVQPGKAAAAMAMTEIVR